MMTIQLFARLVGGARMATHPEDGVVDSSYTVFGVDNLFVVDGSICPTHGAVDPGLGVKAPVVCAADILASR